ncbi:MAG: AAA family ATPase, partial [Nanoarchaeota archaeon]
MTKPTYQELEIPNYVNTRPVFANLTVSDLAKASVLAPLNLLLVGDKGTGKSQLASDVYDHYFGGNKAENGQGVLIRANPDIDIYNEIFSRLNIHEAQREKTDNIDAMVYFVDELNRAPAVAQNQFFGLGDGRMDFKGRVIPLGKDDYHILIATANLGNSTFQGTFETDEALYNRLHVALDFDYETLKPTTRDEIRINRMKEANPNVKKAHTRDISDKILEISREIGKTSAGLGLEANAVVDYLTFGLDNCQRNMDESQTRSKGKVWPLTCQDCKYNKSGDALCSLVRKPVPRTREATRRYAAALYHLAKIKDPNVQVDPVELMFKAFELTGAYQFLLNPQVLRGEKYRGQAPKMMAEVTQRLKDDFRKNEDYILTSMSEAE